MDYLKKCGNCSSDLCYVDEVNQDIKTYFCMSCGYQSNSLMKEGETFYEEQVSILPELYRDLIIKEDNGQVWIPSTTNHPNKGMVFANGPSSQQWGWAAVKAIPVKEDEKIKYPIPGKKNEYYEYRMDMSTLHMFQKHEFMSALSYIDILPK